MSEIKYGLISKTDAATLERTLDLITADMCHDDESVMKITEVGIYSGETGNGLKEYVESSELTVYLTGVDNLKDKEYIRFEYDRLIFGNSNEVYHQLEDESQHLIFLDGCHCFAHVVSDFFCYAPKVKRGAYLAFHDTGRHIKPFKDFQHGDKDNPDAYISCRKALISIGLLPTVKEYENYRINYVCSGIGWELVFDEADDLDLAGGVCVFKKL